MKRRARALVACAVLATVCLHLQPARCEPGAAPAQADRLRAAASELTADAVRADHSKASLHVSPISISRSANPQDATLQRWMDGQLASIDREKQRSQAGDLRALAATLQRLAAPGAPGVAPSNSPRTIARRVLSNREYQLIDANQPAAPHESLWERIATFFGRLLGRIFSGIFSASTSSPIVGQIVAIVLVALLAVAIGYLAFRIVEALMRRRRPARQDDGTPLPERIDPDAFYGACLEAANQGRYAHAVALLFQASLAWFDRQGTLAFDPSLTPAEYRRAVRRSSERASPHFDELAYAFVMAAFAERPVSADDWTKANAAYAQMLATVAA